jgi:UDPglucose 6-dehydrogenase
MNISVIGTGYVGLVTGACLAELGMKVICMDTDEVKIAKLTNSIIPIYEPGLDKIVINNSKEDRLHFTNSIKDALDFADIIFIAVGTPTKEDDSSDLKYVFEVVKEIANLMDCYKIIVTKSTVPVKTGQQIKGLIKNILTSRNLNLEFDVVSNPEFLREGTAVEDFLKPDRIVVGGENKNALCIMRKLYEPLIKQGVPFIETNLETSEIIKYASNAFLATKISFINEIANMCELCSADVTVVAKAMGLDSRIGPKFLSAGPGYGGSCFPKDTRALLSTGKLIGYIPQIVKAAVEVNYNQIKIVLDKIQKTIGSVENKNITILGAAFKPETDDIRESPSIPIIKTLLSFKASIKLYDPQAMENVKQDFPMLNIEYCNDLYSACTGSDAIILITEWRQFKNIDFNILNKIVKNHVFIDLRNVYDPNYIKENGFIYEGVGRI